MQPSFGLLGRIIVAAVLLNGCARSQESFQTLQLCVGDQSGVSDLKRLMMTVAKSEGLQFFDDSARQGEELKAMEADGDLEREATRAIAVHIEGDRGLGVTAVNLGLAPFQVALGFTEGDDAVRAHRLADQLTLALSRRWSVQKVARGLSVLPSETCGA